MNRNIKQLTGYWGPPVALCVAIFIESSSRVPDIGPEFPHFDKVVHFLVFGFLAILFHRAFGTLTALKGQEILRLFLAIATTTLYGVSDELHQWFVPYRSADVWDAVADAIGATVMVAAYWRFYDTSIFQRETGS